MQNQKNSKENFWRKQLRKEANAKFQTRGFLRPKIDNIIENRSILDKSAKPKSLVLARILLFCAVEIKFAYFPTAPYSPVYHFIKDNYQYFCVLFSLNTRSAIIALSGLTFCYCIYSATTRTFHSYHLNCRNHIWNISCRHTGIRRIGHVLS